MKEKTDLEKCKEEARKFLKYQTDDYEGHPLFFCKYVSVRGRQVNLNEHPSTVKRKLKEKKEEIEALTEFEDFAKIIQNTWFQFDFLKNTIEYLDKKDFSLYVKHICRKALHFVGYFDISLKYLRMAQKEYLMTKEEYKKLEDVVTVYSIFDGKNFEERMKTLVWYTNLEEVRRWTGNGYIYKLKINKEDIFMYGHPFYNYELILDYTKLYDLELVEKQTPPLTKKEIMTANAKEEINKIMYIDLFICDKKVKHTYYPRGLGVQSSSYNQNIADEEKRKYELKADNRYFKQKLSKLKALKPKISARKRRAIDYAIDRCSLEVFEKYAFSECLYHIHSKYQEKIEQVNESIYIYTMALIENEEEMNKLGL